MDGVKCHGLVELSGAVMTEEPTMIIISGKIDYIVLDGCAHAPAFENIMKI
jgi:hypothetical protein